MLYLHYKKALNSEGNVHNGGDIRNYYILTVSLFLTMAFSQQSLDNAKSYKMESQGIVQQPKVKIKPIRRNIYSERVVNRDAQAVECDEGFVEIDGWF